ncbi:helix-turn-helix domain-containing protein [Facklamia sp. P12945]|uniref:helix-turn-helix domain-containing protein n=1 Tax=unclassified Facklamia TaxID=2622293 RepID=UPI003D166121
MSKYSKGFKIKLVNEYLDGTTGGRDLIAEKYRIPSSTVRNWIEMYENHGFEGFNKKLNKIEYSGKFELSVIKYRQIHECSYQEAVEKFDLPNGLLICNWNRIYQKEGFSGLNK